MRIYTRTGDDGTTGLFGGRRVGKDDPRVEANGQVDELNSTIGLARSAGEREAGGTGLDALLAGIQADLFVLGADLATPPGEESSYLPRIDAARVRALEVQIDACEAELDPLESFILPGGSALGSALHFARSVCRRAERATVALSRSQEIGPEAIRYLNRLGDLLFVLARAANRAAGRTETEWAPRKKG